MKTWSLALRNLLRNRRRSVSTLLAMVIGLVAILIFGGYRSNTDYGLETGIVQTFGHLQIQRKNYYLDGSDNPTAYGIAHYQKMIQAVKADPVLASQLTMVTPSLQLGGLAGNFSAGISRSVMANGVVVPEFNQMMLWNDYEVKSYAKPLPLEGTSTDTVIIGEGVARKLNLCGAIVVPNCEQKAPAPVSVASGPGGSGASGSAVPDDIAALSALERPANPTETSTRIEMLAATSRGAPNVASLSVAGARNMGIKAMDDAFMAMHLSQAQRLIYGAQEPQVTAIRIQLQHTSQIPAVRARLRELLAQQFKDQDLDVLDFATLNPMYVQSLQFMDTMFGFVAVLIGVIVLFTIGNTMSTAVVERTVEIGTLRAMGLNCAGLRRLFLCEGILLGIVGAVLGVLAALVVAYLINHSGMTWTPPGYSYAYLILVRVSQDPALIAGSVAGLLIVTVISAWLPANRASKLMIVDALRHV